MRAPLVFPSETRDASREKDEWGVNVFGEMGEDETLRAVKRPGLAEGFAGVEGTTGQGVFNFDGLVYEIVDDVLYTGVAPVGAWDSGVSYGTGATVSYQGQEWEALQDSLGQVPASGSAYWVLVEAGQIWVQLATTLPLPAFGNLQSVFGPVFRYDGKTWIADPTLGAAQPFVNSADLLTWNTAGAYPASTGLTTVISFLGGIYALDLDGLSAAFSTNGVSWTVSPLLGDVPAGFYTVPVVFGSNLFVLDSGSNICTSADGITFARQSMNLPHTGSDVWNLVVMGSTLFALPENGHKDVWSSLDGLVWTQLTADWGFTAIGYGVVVFSGRMYVCGGSVSGSLKNTVYSSSDGIAWTTEVYGAVWPVRSYPVAQNTAGLLTVLGGNGPSGNRLDVWQLQAGPTPPTGLPL